jgi:Na+-driven multidrug efflux pump
VLVLQLIPRFGIAGAAVSTEVSYTLAATLLLVMFVRESGGDVLGTVMIRADDRQVPAHPDGCGMRLRGERR